MSRSWYVFFAEPEIMVCGLRKSRLLRLYSIGETELLSVKHDLNNTDRGKQKIFA